MPRAYTATKVFTKEATVMAITRIARHIAMVVVTVFAVLALLPAATFASVKGRRNTAIGLGAASLYSLSRGRTGTGLLLGAGAAYSYKRYANERNRKHHHRRYHSAAHYRTHRTYAYRH
jgi:hypothetical protein